MVRTKNSKRIILIIFLLTCFVQPFNHLLSPTEEGVFDSFSPLLPKPVIASEEEPIDSFDVHPQSGRWENIRDDALVDRITDSQLEVLVINNETSGVDGFEMNRGTTKTDGKFEWRSKAEGAGNQTEYFRDEIGDEADFTEGDMDGFINFANPQGLTIDEGIISWSTNDDGVRDGINYIKPTFFGQAIYTIVLIKAKADISALLQVGFTGVTRSETVGTSWSEITFTTETTSFDRVTVALFDDAGFTNTVYIDYIKLIGNYEYSTHLEGEIEDTSDWDVDNDTENWVGMVAMNVSEGLLRGNMEVDDDTRLSLPISASTVVFFNLTFRIKANVADLIGHFRPNGRYSSNFALTTDWQIITLLREDSSAWINDGSDFTQIALLFDEDGGDGIPEATDQILVDYILLIGDFNPVDSVIGLMDSDKNPLLNISTHFYGNNTARFEFELLDATGELSYHWYSELFGDLDEIFVIGKCSFDVLRSRLEITITAENNSRIDKITFPNEFIEDSGLTPSLFSNVISPDVFVSTYTIDHSWQKLLLDWIKVDFKRAEWVQTDTPADTDWLEDRWDIASVQDDISDDSAWDLYVPYLDTVSASLTMQIANETLGIDDGDLGGVGFQLIGVDWDDGDEHAIYQLSVVQFRADDGGLKWFTEGAISENGSVTLKDFEHTAFPLDESPRLSFSMSLSEERTIASCKVRFWHNRSDLTDFFDLVAEINITTAPFADLSQEFILRTTFTADLLADNEFVGMVEDFGFTDLDIFQDIVNAVIEPIGNFLQTLFTAAFKFLADIFRAVGDVIGLAVTAMQNAVTAGLTTLQTALGAAIGLVEIAIGTLKTALEAAIGLVEAAIGTLQTALEAAIGLVETALGVLEAALETAIGLVETAVGLVQDAIEGVFTFLIAAMADILDEIITVLMNILADVIDVAAGLFFFVYDALGLPDVFAIADALLTGFIQFITAIPQFIADVAAFGVGISSLFVVIGFVWIFLLPIFMAGSAGECIEKMINHASSDLTQGASLLGFRIPVPMAIPWGGLLVFTMLSDTVFFGFF